MSYIKRLHIRERLGSEEKEKGWYLSTLPVKIILFFITYHQHYYSFGTDESPIIVVNSRGAINAFLPSFHMKGLPRYIWTHIDTGNYPVEGVLKR